jgi:parallel beta-helix repeat protein
MRREVRILFAALGMSVSMVAADEGRIPVYQSTTITQPGHYVLTENISLTGGGTPSTIVTISSGNVTLDLNGKTIHSSFTSGNLIDLSGAQNVTIRNGRLSGGGTGIFFTTTSSLVDVVIESVEFEGVGRPIYINGPSYAEIRSCRIDGAVGDGVALFGVGTAFVGRLIDNVVENVGGNGFYLSGLRGGTIARNSIQAFGSSATGLKGIYLAVADPAIQYVGGNVLEKNVIRASFDDYGIVVDALEPDTLISGNVLTNLGGLAIVSNADGSRIESNVVSSNSGGGIVVGGHRSSVVANQVQSNGGSGAMGAGIDVLGNYVLVDGNLSEGNQSYGIIFDKLSVGGVYRNNVLRNNASGAVSVPSPSVATDAGGNVI